MWTRYPKPFSPVTVPAQGLEYRGEVISLSPPIHADAITNKFAYAPTVDITVIVDVIQGEENKVCGPTTSTCWNAVWRIMSQYFHPNFVKGLPLIGIQSTWGKRTLTGFSAIIPTFFAPLSKVLSYRYSISNFVKVCQGLGNIAISAKSHLWGVANPSNLYPSWSAHVADCRLNYLQLSSLFSLNLQEEV